MACPSIAKLDTEITVTCNTVTVPLGTPHDADALPTYEVYEETSDTPILTGSMAKIGAITGFYGATLVISATNGFEVDKAYIVYLEATVNGRNGTRSYAFTILT